MQADIKQFMQVDQQQLEERRFLREKAAAQRIGIKPSTLWLYVRRGWIKSIKLSPKVTVFAVADLDAFVQSRMNIA
jgi:predicted DNA-binding transcriptional regulator AlpA